MSIFGIIAIAIIIGGVAFGTGASIWEGSCTSNLRWFILITAIAVVLMVGSVFACIGIAQDQAKIWVAEYQAQKATIEESLESEALGGLERFELVKVAIELNRELGERQAKASRWHEVYYEKGIYDNLEPIKLK